MAEVRLYLDLVLLRISLRDSVIFFDQHFPEKSKNELYVTKSKYLFQNILFS